MRAVVVFVEHQDGSVKRASLEALGAARSVSDAVVAVLAGPGSAEAAATLPCASIAIGAIGAIDAPGGQVSSPDGLAADLAAITKENDARAFLAAATSTGKDVAPRVAALLDSTIFTDCTGLRADEDGFVLVRPWLAGKLIATLRSTAPVLCATLRRNVFAPIVIGETGEIGAAGAASGGGQVTERAGTTGATVLSRLEAKEAGKLDVGEAPIVVSGGRGLKGPENFHLIEELAAAFGTAATGASRAVVDAGWRPHSEQVGQTGKTVSPQLYVAVGISGAIQHLAGMKTSKVIVAINKDADAPIFKIADYGIVGDAFEVVPALTEAIRKVRAEV